MKSIKRIALCIIIFMMHNAISSAQTNLVTNPSFEDTSSCPNSSGQIYNSIGWSTLISGGGGTPDLFNVCSSICGVPSQPAISSFQYTHTGFGYSGIQVLASGSGNVNYREYIQSKLIAKLSEGHTYCVKFYTSLLDPMLAYIKPLGVYLDNGDVITFTTFGLAYANSFYQAANPQVHNTTQLLNDTVNWMKIEGSFVATGNEEYITIGNFFPDSSSNIGFFGAPTIWASYYYIDDVSMIDAGLPAYAGNDTIILPGDSVFIGRQPEIGLDEDCIWNVNDTPIDTVAGMWVKPDSTTTYILEQNICGYVSYDTVTVIVSGVGIEQYANGKGIKIFPNPNNGTFTISFNDKNSVSGTVEAMITDMIGNQISVINLELKNNIAIFDSKLSNGVYFISVRDAQGTVYDPKIIIIIK